MEKNKIPDEIIKIITQQINNVPSQFDIDFDIKLLNESIKNKKRLWYYDRFDDFGNSLHFESLVEYDHNGIYIYMTSNKISLLYLTSLKSNVDFMVNSLYRINKIKKK
ncbi:hypothetical protein N9E79_00850 [bacterium]|nr:hypothetical protein [bacterium]MDB4234984.1 hypothetical protein [bacterium]